MAPRDRPGRQGKLVPVGRNRQEALANRPPGRSCLGGRACGLEQVLAGVGDAADSPAAAWRVQYVHPGLAAALITLLEGAHVLCRAAGDLEPFDQAATVMLSLVTA
jgi:hypothetical protein